MTNKNINGDEARLLDMDARLEKFLRNEMDAHEEEELIKDMKTDRELADRAKAMAVLIKGVREAGRKHESAVFQEVKEERQRRENREAEPEHKAKLIRWTERIVAVAAMVLLLVGISDFFMARQHTISLANEYMAYAPQTQIDEGALKGGELDSTVISELMPIFKEIEKGENLSHNINLLTNLFDQAASQQVNKYTDYVDFIGYNLAIAHLKNNDRDMARKVLKGLLEIYPDYQMAKELLDKIDEIKGLW